MTTMYLNLNENDDVKRVCKAAFPDYNGRKFRVSFGVKKMSVRSYWDGGSRTYYKMVRLDNNLDVFNFGTSHPVFDKAPENFNPDSVEIPDGFVIVSHSIFCGVDTGLTVHTPNQQVLTEGEADDLTEIEVQVLLATRGLKASYNGVSDLRKHELVRSTKVKMTAQDVDKARESLIAKGYMSKNKAITNKGKNHPLVNGKFWSRF